MNGDQDICFELLCLSINKEPGDPEFSYITCELSFRWYEFHSNQFRTSISTVLNIYKSDLDRLVTSLEKFNFDGEVGAAFEFEPVDPDFSLTIRKVEHYKKQVQLVTVWIDFINIRDHLYPKVHGDDSIALRFHTDSEKIMNFVNELKREMDRLT